MDMGDSDKRKNDPGAGSESLEELLAQKQAELQEAILAGGDTVQLEAEIVRLQVSIKGMAGMRKILEDQLGSAEAELQDGIRAHNLSDAEALYAEVLAHVWGISGALELTLIEAGQVSVNIEKLKRRLNVSRKDPGRMRIYVLGRMLSDLQKDLKNNISQLATFGRKPGHS